MRAAASAVVNGLGGVALPYEPRRAPRWRARSLILGLRLLPATPLRCVPLRVQRAAAARGLGLGATSVLVFAASAAATLGPATPSFADNDRDDTSEQRPVPVDTVHLQLTPSSAQLAACMPRADVDVNVRLTTDTLGFDIFDITARHILPNRDYTVFLLQQAGSPFGAAEYIGDLHTNDDGNGKAEFHLIVQEAFASTLVNGQRIRVDLNRVGMWFADPKDDDVCFGPNDPNNKVTPFDGDNEAGVQAFNSANADPLPAP